MHRSPGVFFDHYKGKTHASGKYLFAARVIPYRGSGWILFDAKDLVHVRIDRRRKLPVTTLLMALDSDETAALRDQRPPPAGAVAGRRQGAGSEDILNYDSVTFARDKNGWRTAFVRAHEGGRLSAT